MKLSKIGIIWTGAGLIIAMVGIFFFILDIKSIGNIISASQISSNYLILIMGLVITLISILFFNLERGSGEDR